MELLGNSLDTLFLVKESRTRRASSYDRSGGNDDCFHIAPRETGLLANIEGAGIVRHIWCALGGQAAKHTYALTLRMYWDEETHPSVEVPLCDFFGIGMGGRKVFISEPLSMTPRDGQGMNCYFPMPFSQGARFTVENETDLPLSVYFYIDYEQVDAVPDEYARFHAQWRRNPATRKIEDPALLEPGEDGMPGWQIKNLDGEDNYVILEAKGRGHYVGCNLNIFNFEKQVNDWYGEGDDMIFIDGDPIPTLNGTGTEDYFNTAYCPRTEYCAPWHGLTVYSAQDMRRRWMGLNSMYRFHIKDPIRFSQSIRVTIEHGHGNKLSNDYSSTAYWYQCEPHDAAYQIPRAPQRKPRKNDEAK